jgi:dihydrolipoamide dehydrogenase
MNERNCDLVVIGAGPGGYVAAARGARLGLSTVLVERDERLGGTCLLRGCIPTKALLQSARTWELCRKGAKTFGVEVPAAAFDWAKIQKRKETVVRKGALGVAALLDGSGVAVVRGRGRLDGPGRVVVERPGGDPEVLLAPKIIVATGSTASSVPGVLPDGERILTSDHLLEIPAVPPSLIVLGAGAVGVEFADVVAAFGGEVTLVEMLPRVLPLEDADCSREIEQALSRRRIGVLCGHRAVKLERAGDGVQVELRDLATGETTTRSASHLLLAVGRRPNTEGLGLAEAGAVVDKRGFVQTDAYQETAAPGVYAIGDITLAPQLAHTASAQALVAAGRAAGQAVTPVDLDLIPSCTYCSPEVASVGLTEEEARARGHEVRLGRFPMSALGKASILNELHGFVKVVAEASGARVLGVHMVGPHATDLIAAAATGLGFGGDLATWGRIVHPHPTLGEGLQEALHDALGMSSHR